MNVTAIHLSKSDMPVCLCGYKLITFMLNVCMCMHVCGCMYLRTCMDVHVWLYMYCMHGGYLLNGSTY